MPPDLGPILSQVLSWRPWVGGWNLHFFPSEKEKGFNFVYRSLSAGGLPFQSSFNLWKSSCVLQSDPWGDAGELGLCNSLGFSVAARQQCAKAVLSVNSSSPDPKPFRSQEALLTVVRSRQHYGFVRRLHPLILSCSSPKQLIKWRQKA